MAEAQRRNASPQEVHELLTRLHDQGVVNLDVPMRAAVDQVRTLRTAEDQGWYIAGGSGWALVVRDRS